MSPNALFTMISFNSLVFFFLVALVILWRRPRAWMHLLMLFMGAFVGLTSVHTDEPIGPAFLLLALSAFAGFMQPGRAWLFALLLAMWVPVLLVLAMVVEAVPPSRTGALSSCLALVPALIGAYVGAGVNRAAGSPVLSMAFKSS